MSVIYLFDLDGTLTPPRDTMRMEMINMIRKIRKVAKVGVISGSDLGKQKEQVDVLKLFDYVFSENGLVSYKDEELLESRSLSDYLSEEQLQELINFTLKYLSGLTLPKKRGTFIEYRTGMINIAPMGRNVTLNDRDEFEQYDRENNIRGKMVDILRKEFGVKFGLQFSIGGQISVDVFPNGWDKTYCLKYLEEFDEIHFFGDKTFPGGNDHELYSHPRVIGHSVTDYLDTISQLKQIFS